MRISNECWASRQYEQKESMSMEKKIAEMIAERLDGKEVTVELTEVSKNNGQMRKAIVIRSAGSNVAPTIYYNAELSDDEIAEYVVNAYVDSLDDQPEFDINEIMSEKYIKSHVVPVLVNASKNAESLDDLVHKDFVGDLAITYKVEIESMNGADGFGKMTLRKNHLEVIGMNEDEVHESAIANVQGKGEVLSLASIMSEMMGADMPDEVEPSIMVVTNKSRCHGAAMILDEDVAKKLRERGDAYVIPSSIHELLVVSTEGEGNDPEDFVAMIRDVNETAVSPEEFLSDNLYKFTENGLEMVEV